MNSSVEVKHPWLREQLFDVNLSLRILRIKLQYATYIYNQHKLELKNEQYFEKLAQGRMSADRQLFPGAIHHVPPECGILFSQSSGTRGL